MKAFLIDPKKRSIKLVEYNNTLEHLYELLDCRMVDFVQAYGNADGMFVDDEGLFVEDQYFFHHINVPTPIAGRALIVGTDEDGNTVEADTSVEELHRHVTFIGDRQTLATLMNWTSELYNATAEGHA